MPGLPGTGREAFRDGEGDSAGLADEYADRLHATERFRACDLELLRVLLHLERNEPRVRARALMWLRCQAMRPQDCDWIGGTIPRTDDADPMRMLQNLARLVDAVHNVPLVLLIDQLEDMANQSAPVDRFLKVVDAITAFTDATPNAVVVLTCLEDYFQENVKKLTRAKYDRLMRDPEPIRLLGNRTTDDIRAMAVRRLAHLYDEAGIDVGEADALYPFRDAHLVPLNGMRSRDALDYLRRHHQRCITAGRWEEPEGPLPPPPPPPENDLDPLWNDFHAAYQATVPDDEDDLARVLTDAIRATADELPDGFHFGRPQPEGRYLEVETHKSDGGIDKLLVAVCNAKPGVSLIRQVTELGNRAGEIPVAIVRTTDFPRTGKAVTQIAAMLKRQGRKVVVPNAD